MMDAAGLAMMAEMFAHLGNLPARKLAIVDRYGTVFGESDSCSSSSANPLDLCEIQPA
jgi:hypothetical protein